MIKPTLTVRQMKVMHMMYCAFNKIDFEPHWKTYEEDNKDFLLYINEQDIKTGDL